MDELFDSQLQLARKSIAHRIRVEEERERQNKAHREATSRRLDNAVTQATATVRELLSQSQKIQEAIIQAMWRNKIQIKENPFSICYGIVLTTCHKEAIALQEVESIEDDSLTIRLLLGANDPISPLGQELRKNFSEHISVLPVIEIHEQPYGMIFVKNESPSQGMLNMLSAIGITLNAIRIIARALA